jgi:hypothetical protein
MLMLATNLALPAFGIGVAALAQLALTTLWPGIQTVPFPVVSLDSYFVVLSVLGLCVLAGRWAQHNASTVAGAACAAVIPLVWLGLNLKATLFIGGSVAWFQPLTIFLIFSASAPLIGVALGWILSSSKLRLRPHGV